MLVFSPIDEQVFDIAAVQISYCKLFPLILEDFITRKDASKMMGPDNLPVTTSVIVKPGQATLSDPITNIGSTTSPASGDGSGNVKPIYDGSYKIGEDEVLAKQKEAIKNAGGQATGAVLDTALGK